MKHQLNQDHSPIHNVSSSPFLISDQTPHSSQKQYYENQIQQAFPIQNNTGFQSKKRGSLSPKVGRSSNNTSAITPAKNPTKTGTQKHGDDDQEIPIDTQTSIKQKNGVKQQTQIGDQQMMNSSDNNNEQRKSEVVNIKVKKSRKQPPIVEVTDVEVWRMTNEQETNISFQDSDVADEFEYLYDPNAYSPNKGFFSPQQQHLQNTARTATDNFMSPIRENKHSQRKHRRQISKTPNVLKKTHQTSTTSKMMFMSPTTTSMDKYAIASMMMQDNAMMERNDLIKRTCRELSSGGSPPKETKGKRKKSLKQRKREFMKRMRQDISMRDARNKTFEEIQEVIIKRMQNHKYNKGNQSQYDISKMLHSPSTHLATNQDRTSYSQTFSPKSARNHQPSGNDNYYYYQNNQTTDTQNHGSATSRLHEFLTPKKLKPKQADQVYKRLMHYEERRVKAIQMLQNAKRMEEDSEYLQSVGYRRLTRKQKKACYERLVQDAERRKMTLAKAKQQQILQLEEELKTMFKPKINNPSERKRKSTKKLQSDTEGINIYTNNEEVKLQEQVAVQHDHSTSLISHLKPGSNVCTGLRPAHEVTNTNQEEQQHHEKGI